MESWRCCAKTGSKGKERCSPTQGARQDHEGEVCLGRERGADTGDSQMGQRVGASVEPTTIHTVVSSAALSESVARQHLH